MDNDREGSTIVGVLEGHTLTVCGLALTPSGQLVSVSWDKTVRVWDVSTRQCTAVLAGHEAAVWDVLCLEDGAVLTASADKTVKRWRGAVCEHTYTVRAGPRRLGANHPCLCSSRAFILVCCRVKKRRVCLELTSEWCMQGHTDCVRALALVPGIGFLSTGNAPKP